MVSRSAFVFGSGLYAGFAIVCALNGSAFGVAINAAMSAVLYLSRKWVAA